MADTDTVKSTKALFIELADRSKTLDKKKVRELAMVRQGTINRARK